MKYIIEYRDQNWDERHAIVEADNPDTAIIKASMSLTGVKSIRHDGVVDIELGELIP